MSSEDGPKDNPVSVEIDEEVTSGRNEDFQIFKGNCNWSRVASNDCSVLFLEGCM